MKVSIKAENSRKKIFDPLPLAHCTVYPYLTLRFDKFFSLPESWFTIMILFPYIYRKIFPPLRLLFSANLPNRMFIPDPRVYRKLDAWNTPLGWIET